MSAPTVLAAVDLVRAVDILRVTSAVGVATDADAAQVARARAALDAAQLVVCPTCGVRLPGLLAQCDKAACLSADVAYEADMDARCDL